METTVLQKTLEVVGIGLLTNITWDLLKINGQSLISSFTNQFKSYFTDDQQAEICLERIAMNGCNSKKYPFDDVGNIYRDCTDKKDEKFQVQFEEWLKRSIHDFKLVIQNQGNVQIVNYKEIKADHIDNINGFIIGNK